MSVTELPFGLAGRIFRSPMPFGDFDPYGEALLEFKQKRISVIVLLSGDNECFRKTKRNLKDLYKQEGFQIIHLPIPDFGVLPKSHIEPVIIKTISHAREGRNVVIHCHAGVGRTGLFAACLVRKVLGLSGKDAILWIRQYIPEALQTDEQVQLVIDYDL